MHFLMLGLFTTFFFIGAIVHDARDGALFHGLGRDDEQQNVITECQDTFFKPEKIITLTVLLHAGSQ